MTDPRMTPTNDAPVTVEPQDRLLFKMVVTGMVGPTKHLAIDRGGFDQDERMQYIARHRLAGLASAPAGQEAAFRAGAEAMQRALADALRDHLNSRAAAIANSTPLPEYPA